MYISENYKPGDFIACLGDLRMGKTMNAIRLARMLHRQGWQVYSNIPISFAAGRTATVTQFFELRDCVFVFDEIQATLDSRNSHAKLLMRLTQESIYIGKRGIILIYTSPSLRMVDIRYRGLTRHVYLMTAKALVQGRWITRVEWCKHSVDTDMLLERKGVFPLYHDQYYGTYPTLFGREPGENLVLIDDLPVPEKKGRNNAAFEAVAN